MARCEFCLFALLSVGAPAWSQASDTHQIPRSEFSLYAGYSLLAPNIIFNSSESGWNAGIDIGIARNVGAVVDFSQYFPLTITRCPSTPRRFSSWPVHVSGLR